MSVHIENRKLILKALEEELVGPCPCGEDIDCNMDIVFSDAEALFRPYRQANSGEEILQRDPPTKRYGVAVLYPIGTLVEAPESSDNIATPLASEDLDSTADEHFGIPESIGQHDESSFAPEDDDFELSGANRLRPSTMGISFLAVIDPETTISVSMMCARYEPKEIRYNEKSRVWWLRRPVKVKATYTGINIRSGSTCIPKASTLEEEGLGPIPLRIQLYARPGYTGGRTAEASADIRKGSADGAFLITVCAVNRCTDSGALNEHSLFQCKLSVTVSAAGGKGRILPYPSADEVQSHRQLRDLDEEEQSAELLYRDFRTYAIGHGCAANWSGTRVDYSVESVSGEALPTFETYSVTSEVTGVDGIPIGISMVRLAGLDAGETGWADVLALIASYRQWIEKQDANREQLPEKYSVAAARHLADCRTCLKRMEEGLEYLHSNPVAMRAFQFANRAILEQQLRSRREPRRVKYDRKTRRIYFPDKPTIVDYRNLGGRGMWRAFQMAFLLMNTQSCAESGDAFRSNVELIWFPTGGGKTEAYLGLAAFSAFMRRLVNKEDKGVSVLMRYTLRLLTAQQFQRASALICAMEWIRRDNAELLGEEPFSIGIWVGSDNTPNTRADAITTLSKLKKRPGGSENRFLVTQCPWCGAELGPIDGILPQELRVLGYHRRDNTVVIRCPDQLCDFSRELPIHVIDEDIYEVRPTIVIGTVDKFAMLAWKNSARGLFGINEEGRRLCSPPELIIQDELHLISGPLGSMVGLYETVIHELCSEAGIIPKIICSTATIRRYREQIRSLYARENCSLFPPPGLSTEDSFFASYARDIEGNRMPGRIYVGVHAPGLGSMQTVQVRVFSSLLQAPMGLQETQRDPWWTLLIFFNSLRELGTTLSLFQSDIPDYFKAVQGRRRLGFAEMRQLYRELELTSRLRNDEVPRAIKELERTYGSNETQALDVCLSSNIIEVGVDIDRLSLMCVVGQPKSTSQYIQVTGRVGRNWQERPGLVVTLLGASKPRDRSHYEQFRSYHERLYAQVEPTSVTPFSAPALDRALHGAMVAYVRQLGNEKVSHSPYPLPAAMLTKFRDILVKRVDAVDPSERSTLDRILEKRLRQWKQWERTAWSSKPSSEDAPLLVMAGTHVPADWAHVSWQTPTSMRNVDAECGVSITKLYARDEDSL